MIDVLFLLLSLLAGIAAGALFFEGLWRTITKAVLSARPVALIILSFIVRTILLLLLLAFVSQGNAFRLGGCMAGFLLGRTIILRLRRGGSRFANQS
jgi:F1F0 ATPase subunit 2